MTTEDAQEHLARYQVSAPTLLRTIREVAVVDEESYLAVCHLKLQAAAQAKVIAGIAKRIRDAQNAARDAALGPWRFLSGTLDEAERLAETKRKAYRDAQARLRAAQLREEEAAARRQAEDEHLANVTALADAARVTGDPLLARAADALLDAPVDVPPVILPPAVPKVRGIPDRRTQKVLVEDKAAFVRAVGAALLLQTLPADVGRLAVEQFLVRAATGVTADTLDALEIDTAWLRREATQHRSSLALPGIKTWQE